MIKNLDGMHEIPDYREETNIRLYKNNHSENYPPHWHFPVELVMPIKNSYKIIADNKEFDIKPYEILYIGSGIPHSTISPDDGERYFLQMDVSHLKKISGINNILSFMGNTMFFNNETNPDIHSKLVQLFKDIIYEYFGDKEFYNDDLSSSSSSFANNNSLCEPAIYGKFLMFLSLVGHDYLNNMNNAESFGIGKKKEYIDKFINICKYIDIHCAEELTLDDISEMAGFSKFHFSRLFKQFTNVSFYKYVNQQRISYAEQLLLNHNISVTQVAIQSGFSSTTAFIRMFKQLKNCTPTEFRNINKNKNTFKNISSEPKNKQIGL